MAYELRLTNTPIINKQHDDYKWFEEDELIKDEDVYFFVKDYFDEKKGIK